MTFLQEAAGVIEVADPFTRHLLWDLLRTGNIILGSTSAAWLLHLLLVVTDPPSGWRTTLVALVVACLTLSLNSVIRLGEPPTVTTVGSTILVALAFAAASATGPRDFTTWRSERGR